MNSLLQNWIFILQTEFLKLLLSLNYFVNSRRPPSKRPNYSVLGVKSPFAPDWNELCDEMSVLRNPSEIENIIRSLGES